MREWASLSRLLRSDKAYKTVSKQKAQQLVLIHMFIALLDRRIRVFKVRD